MKCRKEKKYRAEYMDMVKKINDTNEQIEKFNNNYTVVDTFCDIVAKCKHTHTIEAKKKTRGSTYALFTHLLQTISCSDPIATAFGLLYLLLFCCFFFFKILCVCQ